MKEKAIKKINSMGKVVGILTLIAKIFVCIGFAGCVIAAIALTILPKGFVTMKTHGNLEVNVDMSTVGVHFTGEERSKIEEELAKDENMGDIQINGQHFGKAEVSLVEDSFVVKAEGQYNEFSLKKLIGLLVVAAINVACSFVTLMFVGFLCKAFKECQSPFEDRVIKCMRNLAIAIIPWAFLDSICNSAATSFMMNGGVDFKLQINFTVVVAVLIIFGLTYVFKYGAMLQQESDETL